MRATAIRLPSSSLMLALGLSLAAIIGCATLARAESDVARGAAVTAAAPTGFVCHASPGDWCDLRDWSGMDHWTTPLAQAPDQR